MSERDLIAVFGPQWVQDALESERQTNRLAERIVISLRRKLRASDPALPHEHDGTAWIPIEAEHLPE